jgi:hypothetical protein
MPGYISHKGFFADDGERVTVVEFEHEEGMRAWRVAPSIALLKRRHARFTIPNTVCRYAILSESPDSSGTSAKRVEWRLLTPPACLGGLCRY